MVAWSLKCIIWSYIFLDFHEPGENCETHNFYINRMPISYSRVGRIQSLDWTGGQSFNHKNLYYYFLFLTG